MEGASRLMATQLVLSLAPGFSPVEGSRVRSPSRFNGLVATGVENG